MGSIDHRLELPIIWKDDHQDRYEDARVGRVFNQRRPKRYPLGVVKATCEDQIVQAVKLAVELGCRVSVRSGGHSWAAWSVRDNALLIDLGDYKHMVFDEERRLIEVSPSTTGRVLNGFLLERGYMFCGGHCPDVGLGGFLLQGGMGWNCKNWGWACEKIEALDVVTATGELLHCSANENQDLYWMARGAGPGFPAIVTKFYLEVRKAYAGMMMSFFAWPISRYREVMDWVVDISPKSDEGIEIVAAAQCLPGESEHSICVPLVSFKDSIEEAEASLAPLNRSRPPGCTVEVVNKPTSLPDQYCAQDIASPEGHRYCSDNAYISNNADVTSVLEDAFTTLPNPKAFSIYFAMNPCSRRKMPDMALSMQTDHYFATYTCWEDAADDESRLQWVARIMKDMEKHSEGAYLGDSDFQVRRTRFWADENAQKLMRLRRKWDPEGRICGYLDIDDASGVNGLANKHEWKGVTNP